MNNTPALVINPAARMTSLEIAEIFDKEHKNVMRDIRELIDLGAISRLSFEPRTYTDSRNKEYPMYSLDLEATLTLITGYDSRRRSLVIKRWMALETGEAVPMAALQGDGSLLQINALQDQLLATKDLLLAAKDKIIALYEQKRQSYKPVSAEEKQKIRQLWQDGVSKHQISALCDRPRSTVRDVLKMAGIRDLREARS